MCLFEICLCSLCTEFNGVLFAYLCVSVYVSQGVQLGWESYKLDPYVHRLSEHVLNFQEKVHGSWLQCGFGWISVFLFCLFVCLF